MQFNAKNADYPVIYVFANDVSKYIIKYKPAKQIHANMFLTLQDVTLRTDKETEKQTDKQISKQKNKHDQAPNLNWRR